MNLSESIKTGQLIGKYLAGKESKDEQVQLKTWIDQSSDHERLFNTLKEEKNIAVSVEEFESYNKESAWKNYMERVDALLVRKMMYRWRVAAIFFFLVSCAGVLTYFNKVNVPSLPAGDNTYTTVSTNNGQSSRVTLPDGSVVWINSGTTLSYNTNFSALTRSIKLTGQAFFQIAKNENKPLIVDCNNLKVKVLGTKFDVSAYPDDRDICVVLESGSVELQNAEDQSSMQILKPGEKAEFDVDSRKLSVSNVDSHDYSSWKEGILILKDEPMVNVFKKLERWYNIDIEVKDPQIGKMVYNATIINESIEEIFSLMKFTCSINYTIVPSRDPEIPVKVIISR